MKQSEDTSNAVKHIGSLLAVIMLADRAVETSGGAVRIDCDIEDFEQFVARALQAAIGYTNPRLVRHIGSYISYWKAQPAVGRALADKSAATRSTQKQKTHEKSQPAL